MKVILQKGSKSNLSTLVVFLAKDKKSGKASGGKLSAELAKLLENAASEAKFTGGSKETVFYRECNADGYKNVLFVGLGSDADSEALRVAGAVVYGALKAQKVTSAGVLGDSLLKNF